MRKPTRKNRSSIPSRPVFLILFKSMKLPLVIFVEPGRSKCGLFIMLNPSMRN